MTQPTQNNNTAQSDPAPTSPGFFLDSAMVSTFDGAYKPDVVSDMSLADICAKIQGNAYRKTIERLRTLYDAGKKDAYKRGKERLVAFTPCGTCATKRNTKNLRTHNGIVQADVDYIDPDELDAHKRLICGDPHTVYCFVSPSGHGLKFGAHIQPVTAQAAYRHAVEQIAAYYHNLYGIKWDPTVSNIASLCFVSWDPDCFVSSQATPFDVDPYVAPAPRTQKTVNAQTRSGQTPDYDRVQSALDAMGNNDLPYEEWLSIGMALHSTDAAWACGMWDSWSQHSTKYNARDQGDTWKRFKADGGITLGTLFNMAKQAGWQDPLKRKGTSARQRTRPAAGDMTGTLQETSPQGIPDGDIGGVSAPDERLTPDEAAIINPQMDEADRESAGTSSTSTVPLPYSDTTNAYAFVREHGRDVRYCHEWKMWLIWDGTHWKRDNDGLILQRAKQTMKRMAARAATMGDDHAVRALLAHVKTSLSTSSLKAMLTNNADNEPGIPVHPDMLDGKPWLLNVSNGTLDLQTGILQPHQRHDYLTECLPLAYDAHADCSAWKAFLWRIMDHKQDLIDFLQRVIGLSLTGAVREQCLFIFWGSGANGKSTLVNTVLKLLGPYAMKANAELLMATQNDRHPTERADLFGKRFVATIETRESGKLNETFVKEATGGDPIRARRMREDFWQFDPTHKIILATNHKPQIRGSDYAIWRRIRLVPFTVTIPDDQQDGTLGDTLKAELPGILAWAVRGCLDWQHGGLRAPAEVKDATKTYQAEMDDISKFIAEMCTTNVPGIKVKSSALYKTYLDWGGDKDMSQKRFSMRIEEHGYMIKREKTGMFWQHIGLEGIADSVSNRYDKD